MDDSSRLSERSARSGRGGATENLLNRVIGRSRSPVGPSSRPVGPNSGRQRNHNQEADLISLDSSTGRASLASEEPLISLSPTPSIGELSRKRAERSRHGPAGATGQEHSVRLKAEPSLLDLDTFEPADVNDDNSLHTSCDQCSKVDQVPSYCNVCDEKFCDACWQTIRPHVARKVTAEGVPHEKADYNRAMKIRQCLGQGDGPRSQSEMHQENEHTKWFGVSRDFTGDLIFEDYGRWANILAEGGIRNQHPRYPGLVSFIGQTSAGKSTLIKVLIALLEGRKGNHDSPVAGSVNANLPTSGDVHLYSDPHTLATNEPIFYADCEGLQGGEQVPLGAIARKARRGSSGEDRHFPHPKRSKKHHQSSKRPIQWADTGERRTREYVVANLYPRLLFTFSDVVVFVSRNPKVIESTIERLLYWASKALETSSNQPVLAHLIIVLNASESNLHEEQWKVGNATKIHLGIPVEALVRNPKVAYYVKFWTERGRSIKNATDLLQAYYKSVRVVRVPTGARPRLVDEQIVKLYREISSACTESMTQKRELRMELTAEETQIYLQEAFDQFTTTLHTPFDFVKASFTRSAIPDDFGGSILRMVINMMDTWDHGPDPREAFAEISILVASCMMLDSVRRGIRGDAHRIFPEHYMELCDDALDDFCDQYWPCEFRRGTDKCNNVKNGHTKGHQTANGKVFRIGGYQSSFFAGVFRNTWRTLIYERLDSLLKRHTSNETAKDPGDRDEVAYRIHRVLVLRPFFDRVGPASKFKSHTTCFSCLLAHPEHALPCGHIICTPCLKAYGTVAGKSRVRIDHCPLHEDQAFENCLIAIKPSYAGIRVLSLDGGGVRGIAELQMLQILEVALGGIPVQCFFDLIVGTSAGGLVALGLGAKNWSVQYCLDKFQQFYQSAFRLRKGGNFWVVGKLVNAHYHSKYATSPLEEALRTAFDNPDKDQRSLLFGGDRYGEDNNQLSKVAVVSTLRAGLRPVVLANYNRLPNPEQNQSYMFQRPENADTELEVWESARATAAAPTYFKPFQHQRSKREYLDGGLRHNNPVKLADAERKLLWPERAGMLPDIVLSVGSGAADKQAEPRSPRTPFARPGALSNFKSLYNIAVDHIASSLDAEQAWRDYLQILNPNAQESFRFQRLNITLAGDPPKLDDTSCLTDLISLVRQQHYGSHRIRTIAQHLLASSFFFEKMSPDVKLNDGITIIEGSLQCRFPQNSKEAQDMGRLLKQYVNGNRRPHFTIEEVGRETEQEKVVVDEEVISDMIINGRFNIRVRIKLFNDYAPTQICLWLSGDGSLRQESISSFPISGFPQSLCQVATAARTMHPAYNSSKANLRRRTVSQRQRRSEEIARWTPTPQKSLRLDPVMLYSRPGYRVEVPVSVDETLLHIRSEQGDHADRQFTGEAHARLGEARPVILEMDARTYFELEDTSERQHGPFEMVDEGASGEAADAEQIQARDREAG